MALHMERPDPDVASGPGVPVFQVVLTAEAEVVRAAPDDELEN